MDNRLNDTCIIINSSLKYQIAHCAQLGRYLVASTDIKKGEIILTEQPLVNGPIKGAGSLCPGCYRTTNTNCSLCSWPMCSSECPGTKNHEQFECTLYRCKVQQLQPPSGYLKDEEYWTRMSNCLMIVRCLLLKRTDPKKWSSLLEMEANWDRWSGSPLYSSAKMVEELILKEFGLSEMEFQPGEILKVQAILDINAYEVQLSVPETNIQAAYKIASLAEHNCNPNTHKSICGDSLELTFRAATDIPKGAHISTTYCDVLWPTWHRQQYLQWSKFFTCACERCQSVTELDSHLASFVCMICYNPNGQHKMAFAIPAFTENNNWASVTKDYICTRCNAQFPAIECQMTLKKAEEELAELDKYASLEIVPIFEQWLNKWTVMEQISDVLETCEENKDDRNGTNESNQMEIPERRKAETCYTRTTLLLHPQNSLVLDACHTLFLLYPNENSTLWQLKRKEWFGTHLLKATKPLFTGISKFRGTISYELAMTKATMLVNQLEQSGLTDNLHHLAEESLQQLNESLEMLKYEPPDQPEGKLAKSGASQLEQLASFFSELFPSLTRFK